MTTTDLAQPTGEPTPQQWPTLARELVVDEGNRLSRLEGVTGEATYGEPREQVAACSASPTCWS